MYLTDIVVRTVLTHNYNIQLKLIVRVIEYSCAQRSTSWVNAVVTK